ncbi:early nodulin-like protein 20 [Spinacia oleracea]|uniref:Early nodulin-like protein 20 n=1 Tax=Spinacia oleracea TaxID=3562 RepID=A0A9R0J6U2_SPIOL|nr:early nodulin-like protein 20 [Spinacia oleracea]
MSTIGWVMLLVILMFDGVNGRRVDVGGNLGWNQNNNFSLWASQETFYIGDWLYFRFDKNYFDVLEVNQTSYENCNSNNFIANVTKGGRDVYQLKEARPYYFICSKGYCYGGMKVAINVKNSSLPAPSPQGNNAVGPSMYLASMNFMLVLFLAISVFITLFV